MGSALLTDLLPQRAPSKRLGRHAAFWVLSAVFHTLVFIASDTPWAGSVSWRKPVVFSLSFALMLWACGWILDRLPDRPVMAGRLATTMAVSTAVELVLIIGQQWRGRPSHFATEGTDGLVFALMGTSVGFISLSILTLLGWAIRQPPTDTVERLAVFGGLAMIVSGLGVGQWIIEVGNEYVSQFDRVPETVIAGEAGLAKFPHAVAFHGIQVFMVAAALLVRSGVAAVRARTMMVIVVTAYFGVLVFAALQSFGGRAPLDLDVGAGVLLVASLATLGVTFSAIVRCFMCRERVGAERETTFAA